MLIEVTSFKFGGKHYSKADFVDQLYVCNLSVPVPDALFIHLSDGNSVVIKHTLDGFFTGPEVTHVKGRFKQPRFEYTIDGYVSKGVAVERDILPLTLLTLGTVLPMQEHYYELEDGSDNYRIITKPFNGKVEDRVVFEVNGLTGDCKHVSGEAANVKWSNKKPKLE